LLIDVAISEGGNVIEKENEKILKYKYVITGIQHMWNAKAKMIPEGRLEPFQKHSVLEQRTGKARN
jgi:hypothetical protein